MKNSFKNILTFALLFFLIHLSALAQEYPMSLYLDITHGGPAERYHWFSTAVDGGVMIIPELGIGAGFMLNYSPQSPRITTLTTVSLRGSTQPYGNHGLYYRIRFGAGRVQEDPGYYNYGEKHRVTISEFHLGRHFSPRLALGMGIRKSTREDLNYQKFDARTFISTELNYILQVKEAKSSPVNEKKARFNEKTYFYVTYLPLGFGNVTPVPEIFFNGGLGYTIRDHLGIGLALSTLKGLQYGETTSRRLIKSGGIHTIYQSGRLVGLAEIGFNGQVADGLSDYWDGYVFTPNKQQSGYVRLAPSFMFTKWLGIQLSVYSTTPIKGSFRTYGTDFSTMDNWSFTEEKTLILTSGQLGLMILVQ